MKKKILLFAALLVACISLVGLLTVSSSAATSGYYTYTVSNGEATITDVNTAISGNVTIPSNLGGYPVTSIGYAAFCNCTGLTSITIPDSVTSIGSSAFLDCTGLTSVTFGENSKLTSIGDYAFYGCSSLTTIEIPDSVTSIGYYAFYNCTGLTSITIPDSVTSIGDDAFRGCTGLESITLPFVGASKGGTGNTHFGYIFGASSYQYNSSYVPTTLKTVVITGGTSIGSYAFSGCTRLTSITIPDSVTSIGNYAFSGCTGLTSVHISDLAAWCEISFSSNPLSYAKKLYLNGALLTGDLVIPDGVTSIGNSAFSGCTGLTSVTIPNSVTSIGSSAFSGCTGLTSVTIPNSVTSIGSYAFSNCTELTSITLPFVGATKDGVEDTHFGYIFGASQYSYNATYIPASLKTVVITGGTSIGSSAFYNCKGLTSVVIGDSVTSIGSNAFRGCPSLTSITIPDSVTSIGNYAFSGCTGLTSVTFGENSKLTSIGSDAFYNCTSLTSITIPDSVTSIGYAAFSGCTGLTSITVKNGNSNYHSVGNCLIETKSKTLIAGCKNSIIPSDDSVTRIGNYAFYNCTGLTSITISDSVTSIGDDAFYKCTGLTSITIPDSVTSIGSYAFYDCYKLVEVINRSSLAITRGSSNYGYVAYYAKEVHSGESKIVNQDGYLFYTYGGVNYLLGYVGTDTALTLPESYNGQNYEIFQYAFYRCTSLTSITIPDGVTSIGGYAFYNCKGLTSVVIGDSVTSIGGDAFYYCTGLTSVVIGDSVTSIGGDAFYYCTGLTSVVIGDSVTSIDGDAFYYCTGLTSVTFGENSKLTSIGDYAFYNCTGLTSITIPDSVTSIGEGAFYNCAGLTSITIPDSVTRIGSSAFYNCTGLTSVTFGKNSKLTSIGDYAFYNCTGLTSVHISDLAAWCKISFNGSTSNPLYYAKKLYLNGTLVTDLVIPEGVTSIGDYAFSGCTGLTSVTFGKNSKLTSIGSDAFWGCTGLTSVHISDLAAWCKISFNGSTSNPLYYAKKLYLNGTLVTDLVIPEGVTSIGDYAFSGCTGLTSITIPDSVTSIASWAFEDCTGLTSVHISDLAAWCEISFSGSTSNPLYYAKKLYLNGALVTNLVIPDGVTSIGSYAFSNCTGLTSITIPDSVTSIDSSAFSGCTCLTSITIPDSVTSIGEDAFYNCTGLTSITIPDSVTSIGDDAFRGCTGLESITLPFVGASKGGTGNTHFGYIFGASSYQYNSSYVPTTLKTVVITGGTSIDGDAFYYCTGLTSITIPDSVTSIGSSAFSWCTGLTSVTFGENSKLTSIGASAFSRCRGLTSITIPDSVTSIGYDAFYDCTGLESITLPFVGASKGGTGNTHFGYIFGASSYQYNSRYVPTTLKTVVITGGTSIGSSAFYNCKGLTSVVIGDSVTSIGGDAFYYCTGLTSVVIGDSVTSIDGDAFYYCTGLTSVTFGENSKLTRIGDYAFYNCTGLTSITIPDSVTSIGSSAFEGCTGLTSVTFGENSKLTRIGYDAFSGCTGLESITLPFVGASKGGTGNTHFGYIFGASSYQYNSSYVPTTLKTVVITGGTSIGYYAFDYCKSLMSIAIPDSVTSIGGEAFRGCTGLTSVHISDLAAWCGISFGSHDANPLSYAKKLYLNGALVTNLVIPDGVTSIGNYAFSGCTGLTSITIPDSVTSIGDYAFSDCAGLTSVTFGENSKLTSIGASAFSRCRGLTSITIPDSVTSIGLAAFYNCTRLTSVTFGENSKLTSIGSYAFYNCAGLTSITIPDSVTSIGDVAFNGCYKLVEVINRSSLAITRGSSNYGYVAYYAKEVHSGESKIVNQDGYLFYTYGGVNYLLGYVGTDTALTLPESYNGQNYAIFQDAFSDCTSLTSVTIPDGVTSIGSSAFSGCTGLTSITIPDSVTSIGSSAFRGCTGLTSVTFGENSKLTRIGDYAFSGCKGLTTIEIPDSVTSIGERAFYDCTGLESITLPFVGASKGGTGNTHFGYIFGASSYQYNSRYVPTTLKTVVITGGTSIDGDAFYYCTGLTSITIPDSVTSIGSSAFSWCTGLTSVTFGENSKLTSIGASAFSRCRGLTSITIPDSVTSIGYDAFYDCTSLETVYYHGTKVQWALLGASLPAGVEIICLQTYTFVDEDGTVLKQETCPVGTTIVAPTDPSKAEDALYTYTFAGFEGFTAGMILTEDITFTATYIATSKGVLTLTNTTFHTAWGLEFVTAITGTQSAGTGGAFTLTLDPFAASLISYEAADGIAVVEEGNTLTVTVDRAVEDGEPLLTLTLKASDFLACGETAFVALAQDSVHTATFAPIVIFEMGDVSMDGSVDTVDALLIQQHVVGIKTLTAVQLAYAETFVDGATDTVDALRVQQYVVGMDVTLGDRHTVTFVTETEEKSYTVENGKAFTQTPEANEGYLWSESKTEYLAPTFEAITTDKKYYLVKEEG